MENLDKYWDAIHLKYNSSYDGWLDSYVHLLETDNIIIELGCGRAYCSNYLLEKGYYNLTACDFSKEALSIVKNDNPKLNTMLFDMRDGLPFDDESANVIIADLSLHYFNLNTTKFIFDEIYRVLKTSGYLVARVNATGDKFHVPENSIEIEKNFFYDGQVYKRFFDKNDFDLLFKKFEQCNLQLKEMVRYEKPKVLWEFCVKKVK